MRKLGTLDELSDRIRSALIMIDRSGVEYPLDNTDVVVLREFIVKALDIKLACNMLLEHLLEDIATRCKSLMTNSDLDYLTDQLNKINEVEYLFGNGIKNRSNMYQELIDKAEADIAKLQLEVAV